MRKKGTVKLVVYELNQIKIHENNVTVRYKLKKKYNNLISSTVLSNVVKNSQLSYKSFSASETQ